MKFPAFTPIDLKNNEGAFSVVELPLTQIIPDPNQPRKHFQESALEGLASSIKQHGVIQPIIVRQVDAKSYQIIAGERRWRASRMAELAVLPAIVHTDEPQEDVAISLIENIQREALNPVELAEAFYKLNHDHGLSHEGIATLVGKRRATVSNLLRLLGLSGEARDLLVSGKLEMGHARCLLTLPSEQQAIFGKKIVEKSLTVRDAEKLVQRYKLPKQEKTRAYSQEVNTWIRKLTHRLSSKVAVNINEKGEGRVVIHFSSPEEVDWLVEQLVVEKQE